MKKYIIFLIKNYNYNRKCNNIKFMFWKLCVVVVYCLIKETRWKVSHIENNKKSEERWTL